MAANAWKKSRSRSGAEMDGSGIKSAMVVRGNLGEPEIHFTLDSEGAERFGEITRENVHQRLAIILDGELYSAPVIQTPIETGSGQITGQFDNKEAFELANVLENPLRAPAATSTSPSEVNPTLGKDSIRSGINAAIYGTLAVSVFMLVYYLIAGMVANVALIANIIILLGVMCSIGTTLTLPGIAGIVLTVGMAVDANVLIYERIREETAKGKSLRGAIAAGYARAFGTIFDSHVTTLISSVILMYMGTGSIKGFGVALTIGVAASLFTALVVTRMIFDFLLDRGWLKSLPMFHLIRATKLDFMKLAKPAFVDVLDLDRHWRGYGLHRGKSAFGVDFLGGDTTIFAFEQKAGRGRGARRPHQGRHQRPAHPISEGSDQRARDAARGLRHRHRRQGQGDADRDCPPRKFTPAEPGPHRRHRRPGNPEVGRHRLACFRLFGILIYVAVRYEFSFAVGAVLAVIHDVLMTIGWYCLSGPRVQRHHRRGHPDHHRLLHQRHHRHL